ncbi:relaxase/mobilization nuclease domain-containing protein [Delftia acidovorans]|uniref:relaxase/mobilization nuclease domain-containing protein n=1 Tax=Delftia acidovorans TaxID=80866 RepID=UPI003D14839F
MIISTFKTGKGKSKGPLNYLFGNDKDNKPRDPAPVLLKGDCKLTEVLIDSNHRQYKYTSGAIAFRDNEKPTSEQIEKIINAFEKTFTPDLEERVPLLWVKHEEKGNTELHFICPMQDSKTGKQFNICPPGDQFKQMFKDFQALANDTYGWDQVRGNMLKAQMTELDKIDPENQNNKIKGMLSKEIERKAKAGELNNRDDLITHLQKIGFEITRKGKDYISVKHKKALKATRLKGPAFCEYANYKELLQQSAQLPKLSDTERTAVKKRLARAVNNRRRSLLEQLDNQPKQPQKEPQQPQQEQPQKPQEEAQIAINRTLIEEQHKEQQQPTADLPQSKKPNGFKL